MRQRKRAAKAGRRKRVVRPDDNDNDCCDNQGDESGQRGRGGGINDVKFSVPVSTCSDGGEFKGGKMIADSLTTKAKAMTTTAERRGDWMAATLA